MAPINIWANNQISASTANIMAGISSSFAYIPVPGLWSCFVSGKTDKDKYLCIYIEESFHFNLSGFRMMLPQRFTTYERSYLLLAVVLVMFWQVLKRPSPRYIGVTFFCVKTWFSTILCNIFRKSCGFNKISLYFCLLPWRASS